ncbi:uncharacterized protein [Oscarella lobularis]|uniref:uncharacterized protein isoform X2 n=1 Tax=Oscarella lobularis TaxID=121494 RepID=UPI0033140EDA
MSAVLLLALCVVVGMNSDIANASCVTESTDACPSLPHVPNGEVQLFCRGQKALYICNKGYVLQGGSEVRRCRSQDREWSGTAPECVPEFCDVKELQGISTLLADDGLAATFTCPKGFAPLGDETRTCDPETRNWTNNLFSGLPCRKLCGPVDPIENGVVLQSSAGDSVIYFCDDGFNLVGSSERRCVNGIWTGAMPSCEDIEAFEADLFGVHPVIPLKSGRHNVSSHVFYMASAKELTTITTPSPVPTTGANVSLVNNTIPLTTITTPSPVPTTGANVSPVNNTIPSARARIIPESVIQPAMRSISFYYRIPDGKGNVSVIARLLNLRDNAIVNTSVLHLQASVHSNLTLTPVCIQLLSNLEESFRSRIQLDITVPTGSLFEMRSIETSQTDICKTKSGQCPEISNSTTNRCGLHCRHDGSCPGKMKCCSTSCGVDCLNPINASHVMRRAENDNEDVSFSCMNDTSSGDCGFKNLVCTGGTAWELVHGDPKNPEETNQLPFTSSPGNECSLDVCLGCLFPNSDDDTVVSSEVKRRKRRNMPVTVARSAFCLIPGNRFRRFIWGTMPTERVSSKNTKLEFFVNMLEGGKHHMSVWLRCTSDDSVKIHLGEKRSSFGHRAYHIPHFKNTGIQKVYNISDIKGKIDRQFHTHTDCLEYYVEFQVVAFNTPACVSSIFFKQ